MQQIRRLCAHLAWVGIVVILLAACRSGTGAPQADVAPTPTPDEVMRRDAQEYARMFGISEEQALQEMRYQDGVGDLNAALEANEADTFGGLWIEHEPSYRVIVLFTRNGEKTLRPYLKGKSFAPLVEVRAARYTWADLQAIQAQAAHELGKLDFHVSVSASVQNNRVEVPVSDRAWFESELHRVGAQLPEGVELVVVEGGSTARDKDLLLTPPVPGIAFPRQKPTEGYRVSMEAALTGMLRPEGACLTVQPLGGEPLLPIWPPEFTLRQGEGVEDRQLLVIDGQGQVAARAGEEVYMGGGHSGVTDEWVLQQIPAECRGEYFIVGSGVRPNLRYDSSLFALDVVSNTARTVLFLRYKPALDEQVTEAMSVSGKLVAYDYRRCLHLQTEWGPGELTLLWPLDWSVRVEDEAIVVLDGRGQAVARMDDQVSLRGRAVPHDWEVAVYRQLVDELPGDCVGPSWLVDGID
jgi:hypothetical protein